MWSSGEIIHNWEPEVDQEELNSHSCKHVTLHQGAESLLTNNCTTDNTDYTMITTYVEIINLRLQLFTVEQVELGFSPIKRYN